MWTLRCLFLFLAFGALYAERKRYDGYKLLQVTPIDVAQIKYLDELEHQGKLEIMKRPAVHSPGTVMVPAKYAKLIPVQLTFRKINVEVVKEDVQVDIDREFERLDARYAADRYSFDIDDFNTLDAIYKQYDQWISNCPTGLTCVKENIGQTYLKRDQFILKIGKGNKDVLFLESILHSREWLAVGTELKIIDHIINNYETDEEVSSLINKYDIYFLAVGNPDGYVNSWNDDRYWRRNMRPIPNSRCVGTDLNRNFDAFWKTEGYGPPCWDTYPGDVASSEPETKNIEKYVTELSQSKNIIAHLCIHAYGRMWMFPYGHTKNHAGFQCEKTLDHDDLTTVTNAAVDALEKSEPDSGTWKKGTICNVIYPATGDEVSFVYEVLNVKYAFALELRGRDFVVSPSEIPPSFNEIWNALVAMVGAIEKIEGY